MNRISKPKATRTNVWKAAFLLSTFSGALMVSPVAQADMISEWNEQADWIATQKADNAAAYPTRLAAVHLAMFEAVNAIERRYASYKINLSADREASKEAAAAAAAHAMLVTMYPDQKDRLDTFLEQSLGGGSEHRWNPVRDGEAKTKGLELGRRAAAQVIAMRVNDGLNARESYRPTTQPGVYVPTTIPVNSTMGGVTSWSMTGAAQFRPAAPPALDSTTWTKDLNEIREYGGRNSKTRTAEQTEIGRFWFFTGPRTYNPIVRQIVTAKKLDLVDSARLFALVTIGGSDAITAVFDAKYHYNFWRPITAIRNADQTGNKDTPRDATWVAFGETPMHPEYPCAHCIVSATVSTVLQAAVGNEVSFSLTSPTAPGVVRKWNRLSDYADEVSMARIYGGFHYRFSNEVAKEMGRKIGQQLVATQLQGAAASANR
jgi:hypothetical protein